MSNSALEVFNFDSHQVRVISDDPTHPLFVAKDVARLLGYEDTTQAVRKHCMGVSKRRPIKDRFGRKQDMRVILEPDVYRLIFGSKLKSAVKFQDWVFEEVLPSIRKTGGFQLNEPTEKEQLLLTDGRKALSHGVKQLTRVLKRHGKPAHFQDVWKLVHLKSGMQTIKTATPEQIEKGMVYISEVLEGELLSPAPNIEVKQAKPQLSYKQVIEISERLERLKGIFHPLSEFSRDINGVARLLLGRHPVTNQPVKEFINLTECADGLDA